MKSASQSGQKFVERAGAASGDYGAGVAGTSKDQAAAAIAGKANWAAGIQAAITGDRFAKGLQKSGNQGWKAGVANKGVNRFAEGVSNGLSKYVANSAPYDGARNAAASLPRGPKGSEQNYTRAKTVGQALRALKVGK